MKSRRIIAQPRCTAAVFACERRDLVFRKPGLLQIGAACARRASTSALPPRPSAPDMRNGRLRTLKVPPPSSTSASAPRWASLRIAQGLGDGAIGRRGNAFAVQRREALFGRHRARPRLDAAHQAGPVLAAIGIDRKARIANPFGMADHLHQALEGLLAGDRDHDITVRGFDRPEHRPLSRLHLELRPLHFVQRQAQHRFQHRDVDVLALPAAVALIQRRADGAERIDAGEHVGVIDAAIVRPAAPGLIGEMRHLVAGGGMDDRRIGRQFGRRPGLAVAGDRAIDQFRIELAASWHSRASSAASRRGGNSRPGHRRSRPAGERPRPLRAISGRARGSSCRH